MPEFDPRVIEIVGSGFSIQNYQRRGLHVWSANTIQFVLPHVSLPFWMDDFRYLENKDEKHNKYGAVQKIKEAETFIVSSTWYHDYPFITQYPLKEVVDYFDLGPLNRGAWLLTPAYMMALAIWGIKYTAPGHVQLADKDEFKNIFGYSIKDIKEIHLHGIDLALGIEQRYHQANCMTFWVGIAKGMNIKIKINPASFLLNSNNNLIKSNRNFYYGYNRKPDIDNWETIPDFMRNSKNIEQYGFKPRNKDAIK